MSARVELACRVIVGVAGLWFVAVACWELTGPFGAGHYAAGPSFGVAAENSLKFHVFGPVPTRHLLLAPTSGEIYCHHPWGFYWLMTGFVGLLGHHDWVVRLPAVLLSGLSVPLLYGLGRALWSPVSGAVAVVAFVTLPISLAFCNLSNLEVPAIFGMLLLAWSSVRLLQGGRRGFLWLGLAAIVFACGMDWPAFAFTLLWLGGLTTGLIFPSRFGTAFPTQLKRLLVLGGLLALLTVGLQVAWFAWLGQLAEFLRAGSSRSAGAEESISKVLASRRYWIELSFTWPAVLLGKLMLPVLLARVLFLRRSLEWCVPALLGAAVFHYLVFKNGADVHVFWSHYFAPYYALSLGALAETLRQLADWQGGRVGVRIFGAPSGTRSQIAALVLGLLPSGFIARDGVAALVYARLTGGRFDQHGLLIHSDKDKVAFMDWLSARVPEGSGAQLHPSMKPSFWMSWSLGRPLRPGPAPSQPSRGPDRFYLLDARFAERAELLGLAASFRADVVGPFWAFDRGRPPGSLHGFALRQRAATGWERYWRAGLHDIYSVEPSALHTWELREHLGQPNPPPGGAPARDFEDQRILHNLAVAQGEAGLATSRLAALLRGADQNPATDYADGTQLLGVLRERRTLRMLFRASGPAAHAQKFRVFSRVRLALSWSLVPRDSQPREVGLQSPMPRTLWKEGYLYSLTFELLERPGSEELYGGFTGQGAPIALGRTEPIVIARTSSALPLN